MIKRWLSKLTRPAVLTAAVLALVISPTLGLANTPAKAKQISHHHVRRSVQFQGETPANVGENNDDWNKGWYTPPRSPGFHDEFGS